MPTLQEYIGSLVASVTDARLMSDIQTARLAAEYAKDPILCHFSIPRMRIEDVEMEIAVSLDSIEEEMETKIEPIDDVKFNAIVYKQLLASLGKKKLSLSASQELRSKIAKQTQLLEQNVRIQNNSLKPLKEYTLLMAEESRQLMQRSGVKSIASTEDIAKRIEESLTPEIKLKQTKSRRLNVAAEYTKLSEQKPENFIRLKIKLSETGLEWIRSEASDGKIETKLLPE